MRSEKTNLSNGIVKLKKYMEDLKKKNNEKSEALKSIRNFFLTSTLFKIKIGNENKQIKNDNKN